MRTTEERTVADNEPVDQDVPEDEMSVADSIGEQIEVGHGGIPVFLAVCFVLVVLWALVAWKPWHNY